MALPFGVMSCRTTSSLSRSKAKALGSGSDSKARSSTRSPCVVNRTTIHFPRWARWAVDQDYIDKLSPDERRWLAEFNDCHYGADFRDCPEGWSDEQRKVAYSSNNARQVDAFGVGLLEYSSDGRRRGGEEGAWSSAVSPEPTPEYLDSQEYRDALEEYRRCLSPFRAPRAPEPTERLTKARQQLRRTSKKGE